MSNEPSLKPVLLLAAQYRTFPILPHLSETYDFCVIAPPVAQQISEMGLPAFPLNKYLTQELQEKAINFGYKAVARLHTTMFHEHLINVVNTAFDGDMIPENMQSPQILDWWPGMVGERLRQELTIIFMLEALCAERNVVGCVVHEDVTPDARAIVFYCKVRNIPTVHIPHANNFYVGNEWDIHVDSISDYICAAGTHMRDFYVKWGYDPSRIAITGIPHLDNWHSGNLPGKKESREVLGASAAHGIPDNAFLLVYASSWGQLTNSKGIGFEQELDNSLKMVLDTVKELQPFIDRPVVLCIKMHPGEQANNEQIYFNAMKQMGVTGFATRSYNEYVLSAADVLVAHGPSNICDSAASIGLPCCYIYVEDHEFPIPGPIKVMPNGNLTWALRMALQVDKSKTWDEFAKMTNDAYPLGNASERTAEFIQSVCK